ncbi:retinal pigment epithelial membrane protein-domain-containing protein [Diplogelasinospora grovesii]|uniref:Retinal pigment epithelial membrane protein-domain-containing protein n=1 Tax=Diplogelasinospora grovesii TaxID=303347 RepID=A0AAN6MZW3_9PEZI|nr:retinal pigment epithelial membrane protein-domain-containing protein [Diplogelasinospora grovesii]
MTLRRLQGCYELPSGEVAVDLTVADGNVFFFFPEDPPPVESGSVGKRNKLSSPTMRWILDPKATPDQSRIKPHVVWPTNGEFSRIDDRYVTKPYRHFWQAVVDPTRPYDFSKCGPPAGGLFNCLGHYTWSDDHYHAAEGATFHNEEGKTYAVKFGLDDVYFAGATCTFQEPTFIPKDNGAEGEGYLIALLNRLDELRNDVVIFDAQSLAKGPLATIHLPLKLKLGLHGNFVDHRDIETWQKRRDANGDLGPVQPAKELLPWQKRFFANQDGLNGDVNGNAGSNDGP